MQISQGITQSKDWEGKAFQREAGKYLQTMPTFPSSWKSTPDLLGMIYTGRSSSLPGAWLHHGHAAGKRNFQAAPSGVCSQPPTPSLQKSPHSTGTPKWQSKHSKIGRIQLQLNDCAIFNIFLQYWWRKSAIGKSIAELRIFFFSWDITKFNSSRFIILLLPKLWLLCLFVFTSH